MAMVDLHLNSGRQAVKLSTIASRQNVETSYLEQLFAKLKRGGLVTSVKGPGGGYKLAKTANKISIAEIMEAVDEKTKMTRCNNGYNGCMHNNSACVTHHLWASLEEHIEGFLGKISLADVKHMRSRSNDVGNEGSYAQ